MNPKIEVKDKNGKTPLMEAVDELRHVNVDLLLKKGADPNAQDNNKWNALHCLYRSQSYNFTRYDFSKTEKLLLSYGTFRFVSRII